MATYQSAYFSFPESHTIEERDAGKKFVVPILEEDVSSVSEMSDNQFYKPGKVWEKAHEVHVSIKRAESWANSLATFAYPDESFESTTAFSSASGSCKTTPYIYTPVAVCHDQLNSAQLSQEPAPLLSGRRAGYGVKLEPDSERRFVRWMLRCYPAEIYYADEEKITPAVRALRRNARVAEWRSDCEAWKAGVRGDLEPSELLELHQIFEHVSDPTEFGLPPRPTGFFGLLRRAGLW